MAPRLCKSERKIESRGEECRVKYSPCCWKPEHQRRLQLHMLENVTRSNRWVQHRALLLKRAPLPQTIIYHDRSLLSRTWERVRKATKGHLRWDAKNMPCAKRRGARWRAADTVWTSSVQTGHRPHWMCQNEFRTDCWKMTNEAVFFAFFRSRCFPSITCTDLRSLEKHVSLPCMCVPRSSMTSTGCPAGRHEYAKALLVACIWRRVHHAHASSFVLEM